MISFALSALLMSIPHLPLLAPPSPVVCLGLTDAQLAERVGEYLKVIDVPIAPDRWRALGPKAAPLLEQVVSDPSALPTRRALALWALVQVTGLQAQDLLGRLALREDQPFVLRQAALRGLAAVAAPGQLEAVLRPIMERAGDGRLRAAAAHELVRRTGGGACALVRDRIAQETPSERTYFAEAAQGCVAASTYPIQ
jgi:hypothetical protein